MARIADVGADVSLTIGPGEGTLTVTEAGEVVTDVRRPRGSFQRAAPDPLATVVTAIESVSHTADRLAGTLGAAIGERSDEQGVI